MIIVPGSVFVDDDWKLNVQLSQLIFVLFCIQIFYNVTVFWILYY